MKPLTTQKGFIEALCCRYQGPLIGYLTRMLGNRDIAREVAQDAFAKVYATYHRDVVRFPRATLFRVAERFALMQLRHWRVEGRAGWESVDDVMEEVPDQGMGPDRQAILDQTGALLAAAITGLRPNLRDAFVMAHVEGRPRKEVAMALGVSEKRLDKRMTKALKECRARLASHGIDAASID